MAEYTFLKLNFEDADLTANAPYSQQKGEKTDEPTTEESSKKGAVIAALIGLCFCVAVAYIVRKKVFGGDQSESDEFDEEIEEFTVEA